MRRRVVDALLVEQGSLCAYCNARITHDHGRHHIDHLLPRRLLASDVQLTTEEMRSIQRSGIPRETLDIDHRNLLACCPNQDGKAGRAGCGDHKGSRILPLTPLELRCETAFRYLSTGTIEPESEDGRAAIRILGLDRRELNRARREALEGWLLVVQDPMTTPSHLQRLLEGDPLPEFIVAAEQLLRTMGYSTAPKHEGAVDARG
jgi:uncharacterized protein (TIGR02646 family)